jgi:hypothetical protein
MGDGGIGNYSVRERLFESLVEYLLREPLKTPVGFPEVPFVIIDFF